MPIYVAGDLNVHLDRPDSRRSRRRSTLPLVRLLRFETGPIHKFGRTLDAVVTRSDVGRPEIVSVIDVGLFDHNLLQWQVSATLQHTLLQSNARLMLNSFELRWSDRDCVSQRTGQLTQAVWFCSTTSSSTACLTNRSLFENSLAETDCRTRGSTKKVARQSQTHRLDKRTMHYVVPLPKQRPLELMSRSMMQKGLVGPTTERSSITASEMHRILAGDNGGPALKSGEIMEVGGQGTRRCRLQSSIVVDVDTFNKFFFDGAAIRNLQRSLPFELVCRYGLPSPVCRRRQALNRATF